MQANLKFARPLAVALGLFALSGTAYAADVVSEEPPAPAAPIAELPVASWAGPYAGISAGYGFSGHADARDAGVDVKTKGFVGGVFGGYQWQQENFVYGAEADLGYNGVKGDSDGIDAKGGFEGSLRARLGYSVTPEILLYGTGGGAGKNQKITDSVTGDRRQQCDVRLDRRRRHRHQDHRQRVRPCRVPLHRLRRQGLRLLLATSRSRTTASPSASV